MNENLVIIGGRLTRDPAGKFLPNQTFVCEFGVATNRKFRTAGGEDREEVLFVDCSAFGKTGEGINQHFTKGKAIYVKGRLKRDEWEDKNGGGKRSKISVIVDNWQFVGAKGDGGGDEGGGRQGMDDVGHEPPGSAAGPGTGRPPQRQERAGGQMFPRPAGGGGGSARAPVATAPPADGDFDPSEIPFLAFPNPLASFV